MPEPIYDESIYPRVLVNEARVQEFAQIMRERGRGDFPPIKIARTSGKILDGVHRWLAAKEAGILPLTEFVDEPPSREEAVLIGAGLNKGSLPLDTQDKIQVIGLIKMLHPEWTVPQMMERLQVDSRLGISRQTLTKYVQEWEERQRPQVEALVHAGAHSSNEIAQATGVRPTVVNNIREELQQTPVVQMPIQPIPVVDGETFTLVDGEPLFQGAYAPDVPAEKVQYRKSPTGLIEYQHVKVDGEWASTLASRVVDDCRKVSWVGINPLYHHISADDARIIKKASAILQNLAIQLEVLKTNLA